AVEVVAVGLGEPGPGEDPVDDLAHAAPPTRSYAGAPPRVNPTPRLYTRAFWIACAVHFTGGMSMGIFLLFPLFVRALGGGARPTPWVPDGGGLGPAGRRIAGVAIFGVAGMAPNGLGPWLGEAIIERTGFAGFLFAATGFALVSRALTTLIEERGAVPVHAAAPRSAARDMARLVLRGGLLPVMAATGP